MEGLDLSGEDGELDIGCFDEPVRFNAWRACPFDLVQEMPVRREAELIVSPVGVAAIACAVAERVRVDLWVEEFEIHIVVCAKQAHSKTQMPDLTPLTGCRLFEFGPLEPSIVRCAVVTEAEVPVGGCEGISAGRKDCLIAANVALVLAPELQGLGAALVTLS